MNTVNVFQNRFFAALFSLSATAALMAYAIIPASPSGLLV